VTEATAEVVAEAVPLTRVLVGPPGPDRVEIEMEAEGLSDPCEWGQLDSCAADRITSSMEEAEIAASAVGAVAGAAASQSTPTTAPPPPVSTAGTPYSSPGGRWTNFQKYSTFQVRRQSSHVHPLPALACPRVSSKYGGRIAELYQIWQYVVVECFV